MLLRERDAEAVELRLSLRQLKRIYVAMFRQLHESDAAGFDALDEDDMLMTIQTYLQRRAAQAGVDATIHADWEEFLGIPDASSRARSGACSLRSRSRRLEP
jgi:hypothetical protein